MSAHIGQRVLALFFLTNVAGAYGAVPRLHEVGDVRWWEFPSGVQSSAG